MRGRGADAVVLFGNSGGGSLSALAHTEHGCGDGWVGVAAHPGEGEFMLQSIDPSVADEHDPSSVVPELDMYDPANGWRPWPEPSSYDPDVARRGIALRSASASRASTRGRATNSTSRARRGRGSRDVERGTDDWRRLRKRAVHLEYFTIYRTLANPTYLDLSIEPDDRPLGSLFAFPDPFDANYGWGGLGAHDDVAGLVVDVVGALVAGASSRRRCREVHVPVLVVHPTADTEIRIRQAREIADAAGSDDVTYVEIKGAPHYLEGHRPEAMEIVADWIRKRFP